MSTTFRGCILSLTLGAGLFAGTYFLVRPICSFVEQQSTAIAFASIASEGWR